MSAAAIVSLVIVGILVAALAFYLIRVVIMLRGIIDTLGKVTFGVRAIAHRVQPVNEVMPAISRDLLDVAEALEGLVAKLRGQQQPSAKVS